MPASAVARLLSAAAALLWARLAPLGGEPAAQPPQPLSPAVHSLGGGLGGSPPLPLVPPEQPQVGAAEGGGGEDPPPPLLVGAAAGDPWAGASPPSDGSDTVGFVVGSDAPQAVAGADTADQPTMVSPAAQPPAPQPPAEPPAPQPPAEPPTRGTGAPPTPPLSPLPRLSFEVVVDEARPYIVSFDRGTPPEAVAGAFLRETGMDGAPIADEWAAAIARRVAAVEQGELEEGGGEAGGGEEEGGGEGGVKSSA